MTITFNRAAESFDAFEFVGKVPNTAIFGGFLRDMFTGREQKDLDMIVTEESKNALLMEFVKKGWAINPLFDTTSEDFNQDYSTNNFLVEVIKCYPPVLRRHENSRDLRRNAISITNNNGRRFNRNIPVDILVITCPVEHYIRHLPIGSSQVGLTRDGIIRGELFDRFMNEQVLCFGNNIRMGYIDRIVNYYNNPRGHFTRRALRSGEVGNYRVERVDDSEFFDAPQPRRPAPVLDEQLPFEFEEAHPTIATGVIESDAIVGNTISPHTENVAVGGTLSEAGQAEQVW